MELKDFKEYAFKTLSEYEQLNNELRTLRETYIVALNNFYKDNKVFFYTDKEEFSKEFLNGEIFNKANSLLVHSALISEAENNVKMKYSELVEAFNMLDKLWERKDK